MPELIGAGFTLTELKDGGYSVRDFIDNGYSNVLTDYFSAGELLEALTSSELRDMGFTINDFKAEVENDLVYQFLPVLIPQR